MTQEPKCQRKAGAGASYMRLRCEARNRRQVQKLFPGAGRSQRKESKSQLGLGEGLDPGWD